MLDSQKESALTEQYWRTYETERYDHENRQKYWARKAIHAAQFDAPCRPQEIVDPTKTVAFIPTQSRRTRVLKSILYVQAISDRD